MSKSKSNTSGAKAPARSGGGATMNKNVRVPIRSGSPNIKKANPDVVSNIGRSIGNHSSEGGGKTTQRPNQPLYQETKDRAPLGNQLVNNVGAGGPGAGRILHGQSGSQGQHGPVNPGGPGLPRTPGGGPGGFGFTGKGD